MATTQLIIRLDERVKVNFFKLAKADGKNSSLVIRELIESYIQESSMDKYIDDLWKRVGRKLNIKAIKQKEIVKKNKEEMEDFIGDVLFLIIKIANQANVDVEKSIKDVLEEYEKRMPPEIMKKLKHANKKAGGYEKK